MDLDLLTTSNAAPTEDEQAFLLDRISSLDGSIDQLDCDLAQTSKVLEELHLHQSILRSRRKAYTSLVSLFRRLPVDVWIDIMKFTIWSTGVSASAPSTIGKKPRIPLTETPADPLTPQAVRGVHYTQKAFQEHTGTWLEAKQLSVLTRVCQDWRRLLHDSPIFWSALELQIYANDPSLDDWSFKIEDWLRRSETLPWTLKLLSSKRQLHAPVFVSFLQRNCAKWKELRLCMQDLDILAPLFHLEASAISREGTSTQGPHGVSESNGYEWTNLEVLSLDGWFTEQAKLHPFAPLRSQADAPVETVSEHHLPLMCLSGAMPRLTSLTLETPCQKISNWKWIPWAQLVDVDLKTGDSYEDNVLILSKCSALLERCTLVFSPSVRHPAGPQVGPIPQVTHGAENLNTFLGLGNTGAVGENITPSVANKKDAFERLLFPNLKELTLRKLDYLSPVLSRLTLPALQKLFITMSPLNEPEPYLAPCLIDFLDRCAEATTTDDMHSISPGPTPTMALPLTYLTLALENTRRRGVTAPVITTGEYVKIFERMENLRTLHLKDYCTDAQFLDQLIQKGLMPRLKTVSFVVDASEKVSRRFDVFVESRTRTQK